MAYKKPVNPSTIKHLKNQRSKGICFACGIPCLSELHHLIPRAYEGPNVPWNFIHLCTTCHDFVEGRAGREDRLLTRLSWLFGEIEQKNDLRAKRLLGLLLLRLISGTDYGDEYLDVRNRDLFWSLVANEYLVDDSVPLREIQAHLELIRTRRKTVEQPDTNAMDRVAAGKLISIIQESLFASLLTDKENKNS